MEGKSVKKILVIRYKKSVGDTIIGSTLCESIKKYFPNEEVLVDFLVYENLVDLFKGHKYINQVLTLNRKNGVKGFLTLIKEIRKNKYDIVVDCRCIPQTVLLSILSGANTRIGKHRRYRSWFYTTMVKGLEVKMNQVEKYHLLLKPLGIQEITKQYNVVLEENEKKKWKEKMQAEGIDFNKLIVSMVVAARQDFKQYPKKYTKLIIENLIQKYDAQIIFTYAPSEREELIQLYEELGKPSNIFVDLQTKSTRDLAGLFSNCDIFLGNEGGSRHIAEFVGLANLAIVSPETDKKEWICNENERNQCISVEDVDGKTYEDISPDYVLERFDKQIKLFNFFGKK